MDRRSFLGRLVIGAAAVLGMGAAKGAEASEPSYHASHWWASDCQECQEAEAAASELPFPLPTGVVTWANPWPEPFTGRLEAGTYLAPTMPIPSNTTIRGAGTGKTAIVGVVQLRRSLHETV